MTTHKIASLITGLCLSTAAGFAQANSWNTSRNLGDILGSESACGITLDAAAIKQWIGANVSAEDLEFTSSLRVHTDLMQYSIKKMSPSLKEAHCTQIKRTVETLKLGN